MKAQWNAAVRNVDVTQISGTGVVAWVLELDHGHLMWWDTVLKGEPTETMEWYDLGKKFDAIHGHGGCTRLVPVETGLADRGRELMTAKLPEIQATFADLHKAMEAGIV
jgi:hypothetical protein